MFFTLRCCTRRAHPYLFLPLVMLVCKWFLGLGNHFVTMRQTWRKGYTNVWWKQRRKSELTQGLEDEAPELTKPETAWPPDSSSCEIMYFVVVVVVQTTFTSFLLASITYWGPKKDLHLTSSAFNDEGNQETALESTTSRKTAKIKPRCIAAAAAAAKSLQSCPTLCDPIDNSSPGFPVPGILQARALEWVTISFSNASKWEVKGKSLSRVRLLATPWTAAHQAPPLMGFSRQEYWSGVSLPSQGE